MRGKGWETIPYLRMDAPIENYKMLACAVIEQAVEDYYDGTVTAYGLRQLMKQPFVRCLDIDGDYIVERAVLERRRRLHAKEEKEKANQKSF